VPRPIYPPLLAGNLEPEYELLDTGVFDEDRYWIVEVDYAKSDPHDLLISVRVTNAGRDSDTLHVLPSIWFRNTWRPRIGPGCSPGSGVDRRIWFGRSRSFAAVLREPNK
jgi:hypothetical protein